MDRKGRHMEAVKKNPLSMQIDPALFEPATDEEKQQQEVMSESVTFFRDGMRKLMKNPLAVGSIIVLALIIITIVFAPLVVPYSYSGIAKVNALVKEGDTVLTTIITDGEENCSREYSLKMVKNLIDKLKKQGWTFTLIGTDDLDVEGMAGGMGIRHSMAFARNEEQACKMFEEERKSRRKFYDRVKCYMAAPTSENVLNEDEDFFDKKHV